MAQVVALGALAALAGGCGGDKKETGGGGERPAPRGAPPPPSAEAAAKPGACKAGGGEVKDPVSAAFFPRVSGGYCVNPEGETKAFGDKAPKPIEGICGLFDGGCELYRQHQVKRTASVDYVDGAGSPATVTATLSQFASSEYAYAMFTRRVTSDEDPARADMPKAIDVGVQGALGTGSLYAQKGPYLLELSYVNTDEDEKRTRASGERVLPPLAKDILAKLPGGPELPPAAAKLPQPSRLPLGVAYAAQNVLGVEGTGPGALGYYREGERRYRVLVISKADADQAKDVLKSFSKKKGAAEEKGLGEAALRLMLQEGEDSPKAEWLVARQGPLVVGVGDEPFAAKPGGSAADYERAALSRDEKRKRLQALLGGVK
ncbi:MAG TPA: DUF6599 family protein [Polyangiaceae bacterium]|nr:DUF6599 family protein [Polyangiaceae bacterium]